MGSERERVEAFWRERYARIRLTADGAAATWLDYSSDPQRGQKLQAQTFALVMEALGVVEGTRVLDAGCGWGEFAMALAALGAQPVGLDLVDATIEALRVARPDLEWVPGSFLDAPTLERIGLFDRIVAIESFQCAGPPLGSLRRLWSAVAPGGRLVVIAPNAACPIVTKAVAALAGNLFAVEPAELVAAVRALPGLTRYALRGLTFASDQWLAPYSASAWAQDASEWPTANRLLLVCER